MDQGERSAQLKGLLQDVRALVDKYEGLTHSWRFATSALWAMQNYYTANALEPAPSTVSEATYVQDTKQNLDALIVGKPFSKDWERGFWFNAAIMRLDALWERFFKLFIPSGVNCDGPCLYHLVQARRAIHEIDKYENSSFGKVRKIVNQLKHEPGGAHPSIRENHELPVEMFEDLLVVIRDPALAASLESAGKGPVVVGRAKRRR
jgi:hypothetical protein